MTIEDDVLRRARIPDETTTINGGCDPATHEGLPVFGPGWGTPGDYACFDPQGN